jgi:PEP-CTERM motif-containing protein
MQQVHTITTWLFSAAAAFLLSTSAVAHAAVIPATVTCALGACTVTPDAGPIAVDPTGFTLDVDWTPQDIVLSGLTNHDWWALNLVFDFTGIWNGTEHFGPITLLDELGAVVPNLNPQFDDVNFPITANYQIFNNGADFEEFFVRGLHLAPSDGSGVDTLDFTAAVFRPASVRENQVPEPVSILLLGAGLAAVARRRFRS